MRPALAIAAAMPAVLAGLAAAPPALADNLLTISRGEAAIRSEDAGVANAFEIDERGSEVRFYEPNDPKGIFFPAQCRPGATRGGAIIEVFCPRSAITKSIAVLTGPAEDTARYSVAGLPGSLQGDTGADRLTSTAASNDVLDGEQGSDTLDAGPGDDTIDLVDGVADSVACGAGTDTVTADQFDQLSDCENVQRRTVDAAPGQQGAPDRTPPRLLAAARTSQRIGGRRRWITVVATTSEPGVVNLTGYLEAGGVNDRLDPVRATVTVGGGGVALRLKLTRRQLRLIARDLRRHRRPRVRLTASSVDAAGNTSRVRRVTIQLRR